MGMGSISVQHQDWQAFVLWKGCLDVSFVRKGSDLIFRFPVLHLKKPTKIASGTIPYHSLPLHNCWRKKSGDHQLRLVAYPNYIQGFIQARWLFGIWVDPFPENPPFSWLKSQPSRGLLLSRFGMKFTLMYLVQYSALGDIPFCHRSWVGSR